MHPTKGFRIGCTNSQEMSQTLDRFLNKRVNQADPSDAVGASANVVTTP